MKVWLDWDSGTYESVSDEPTMLGIEAELSEEEWRDWQEVSRRYAEWQDKLERLRNQCK
jgi:hypothetical protein